MHGLNYMRLRKAISTKVPGNTPHISSTHNKFNKILACFEACKHGQGNVTFVFLISLQSLSCLANDMSMDTDS